MDVPLPKVAGSYLSGPCFKMTQDLYSYTNNSVSRYCLPRAFRASFGIRNRQGITSYIQILLFVLIEFEIDFKSRGQQMRILDNFHLKLLIMFFNQINHFNMTQNVDHASLVHVFTDTSIN